MEVEASFGSYDVGKNIVLPYLLDRGVRHLDYAILSHLDSDHCEGVFTVMEEMKVENVIIGEQFEDSENYQKLIEIVNEKNINIIVAKAGEKINIEKNIFFDVLWPSEDYKISENVLNNNSLVVRLCYKNFKMLFTGDIEEVAEKAILKKYSNYTDILKSTVLKVAHHGSKTSSTTEFIKMVNPNVALIGVGEDNNFGHPSDIIINNLEDINCKIFRTDEDGEITITTNGKRYKLTKFVNNR